MFCFAQSLSYVVVVFLMDFVVLTKNTLQLLHVGLGCFGRRNCLSFEGIVSHVLGYVSLPNLHDMSCNKSKRQPLKFPVIPSMFSLLRMLALDACIMFSD